MTRKFNWYDILKFVGQIVLPALLAFIGTCGETLCWDCTEIITRIGASFIALWNAVIVGWNKQWQSEQEVKEIE